MSDAARSEYARLHRTWSALQIVSRAMDMNDVRPETAHAQDVAYGYVECAIDELRARMDNLQAEMDANGEPRGSMRADHFLKAVLQRTGAEAVRLTATPDLECPEIIMFFGQVVLPGLIEPTDWDNCAHLVEEIGAYVDAELHRK